MTANDVFWKLGGAAASQNARQVSHSLSRDGNASPMSIGWMAAVATRKVATRTVTLVTCVRREHRYARHLFRCWHDCNQARAVRRTSASAARARLRFAAVATNCLKLLGRQDITNVSRFGCRANETRSMLVGGRRWAKASALAHHSCFAAGTCRTRRKCLCRSSPTDARLRMDDDSTPVLNWAM